MVRDGIGRGAAAAFVQPEGRDRGVGCVQQLGILLAGVRARRTIVTGIGDAVAIAIEVVVTFGAGVDRIAYAVAVGVIVRVLRARVAEIRSRIAVRIHAVIASRAHVAG